MVANWVSQGLVRDGMPNTNGGPVAIWSGGVDGDALFAADFRSWGPGALAEFTKLVDERVLAAAGGGGQEVWLRPHARHVLCDSVRAERFTLPRVGRGLRLLADPLALLTPRLLGMIEEHVDRAFESIARVAAGGGLAGIVLANVEQPEAPPPDPSDPEGDTVDDGPVLRRCAVHRGVVPVEMLVRAMRTYGLGEERVVLVDSDFAGQVDTLRTAGMMFTIPPQ